MNFIDLFSGLGGFHIAASSIDAKCVFACEINKELQNLYYKNFGILPHGDIRSIQLSSIPKHDLLCAGFPCQPFSKAGNQAGWRDKIRGTLFENIANIIEFHKPKYVLLENVANFTRHDKGNTFARVNESLKNLGYNVQSKTLSPHQFGIPHFRERVFIVALRGSLESFAWPKPFTKTTDVSICDILDEHPAEAKHVNGHILKAIDAWQEFLDVIPSTTKLPSFPIWSMEFGATYPIDGSRLEEISLVKLREKRGRFGQHLNYYYRRDILDAIPPYSKGKYGDFPQWKRFFILENRKFYLQNKQYLGDWLKKIKEFPPSLQKFEWNCQNEERNIWKYVIQVRASGIRVKRATTAPSLVAMTDSQIPIIGWEKRYMTEAERVRLQSMQDLKHYPTGKLAVTALGNAVNVHVARLILKELLKF